MWWNVAAYVLMYEGIFFGAVIAAAGGLGGGGIYTPLLVILGGMNPHEAIPISKAIIFGGAFSNVLLTIAKRHPVSGRSLIHFEVALLFEPITISGTVFGVILNIILPSWFILILLMVLITLTALRTTHKAIKLFRKESKAMREEKRALEMKKDEEMGKEDASDKGDRDQNRDDIILSENGSTGLVSYSEANSDNLDDIEPLSGGSMSFEDVDLSAISSNSDESEENRIVYRESEIDADTDHIFPKTTEEETETSVALQIIAKIQHYIYKWHPWRIGAVPLIILGIILFSWFFLLVLTLLKGGRGSKSPLGIEMCTPSYWTLTIVTYAFGLILSSIQAFRLILKRIFLQKLGKEEKLAISDEGMKMTIPRVIVIPIFGQITGVLSATLGIGGAIVTSPLLNEFGMDALSIAATSNFMFCFTSSSSVVQYLIHGSLNIWDFLLFVSIGFIAFTIGKLMVYRAVKSLNRPSYIVFAMAIVMGISCVMMGIVGFFQVYSDWTTNQNMGLTAPC